MIKIDAAGFVEGSFFAPVGVSDAQVRLVTEGGNGTTGATLGHLTALMYLRGDPSALCPDTPTDGAGCAIPEGVQAFIDYGEFADTAAFHAYADAIDYSVPEVITGGYYIEEIDGEKAFNDSNALKITPTYNYFGFTQTYGFVDTALEEDKTLMLRFYMDAVTHESATGLRDGFMIVAPYSDDQYLNVLIQADEQLWVVWQTGLPYPDNYAGEAVGPASLVFDKDVEVLCRLWRIDAATRGFRLYIHDPCAEPILIFEKLDLPDVGTDGVIEFEYLWNVSTWVPTPTTESIWIHQVALSLDPTVFGIPL